MLTRVVTRDPWDVETDVLAVPVASNDEEGDGLPDDDRAAELDRRLGGALGDLRRVGEVSGKAYGGALVRATEMGAAWVMPMGIGKVGEVDRLTLVRFGAAVERRLGGRKVKRVAIYLPSSMASDDGVELGDVVELVTRGVVEGTTEPGTIYRDKVETAPPDLDELVLVVPGGDETALQPRADRGRVIGEGANRARRLSQRASNDVSPEVLADEATALANKYGLTVEVYGPEWATEQGMGMFMAVGRGSDNPPRFIVLRSGEAGGKRRAEPGGTPGPDRFARSSGRRPTAEGTSAEPGRLLAMVGKGVTFDSGGISIKPADRMEEMKMDKTGACTVLSAIATVAELAPGTPLMAVAPAVENMPGPHSTRPGDIVKALNGKIVEVNNTDAEGRLILGDALVWAEQQGATHLVDVATLTGAVERAFGKLITGGFGTPQDWWDEVHAAGARQGERYWQVPLIDDYRADMDSWYADFTNTGTPDGGLIKSGMFLKEFVTKPWAHLDIGGSGYLRRATPWSARGATGVTHATLVELALNGS